jgi:hypothetical protein
MTLTAEMIAKIRDTEKRRGWEPIPQEMLERIAGTPQGMQDLIARANDATPALTKRQIAAGERRAERANAANRPY